MSSKSIAELDEEFEKLSRKVLSKNPPRESIERFSEIALERELLIYNQLRLDFKLIRQRSKLLRNPRDAASLLKVKYDEYGKLRDNVASFLEELDKVRDRGFDLLKALHSINSRFNNDIVLPHDGIEVFNEVLKY